MLKKQENLENGSFSQVHRLPIKKFLYLSLFTTTSLVLVLDYLGKINFVCPFYSFFNLKCLTCHSTRAINVLLVDHDIIAALIHNPLVFLWITIFGISFIDFFSFTCLQKKTNLFQKFTIYIQKKKYLTIFFYIICILNLLYLNNII